MVRRTGTYERYREQFTQWIHEEGRTHAWIAWQIGKSKATAQLIAQALEIYTRTPRKPSASAVFPKPLGDTRSSHSRTKSVGALFADVKVACHWWDLPRDFTEWRRSEVAFQRIRLTHCGQWDRGW